MHLDWVKSDKIDKTVQGSHLICEYSPRKGIENQTIYKRILSGQDVKCALFRLQVEESLSSST